MSQTGRKRKPSSLKLVQGTYRKDRAIPNEPMPKGDLMESPSHLNDEQREVWEYAIANAPKGLLKRLDRSVLEVWVRAYVFYREAADKVLVAGQVIKTPNGYPVMNPYMANMNKQAQIMLKAASEMGFTPASRTRISVTETASQDNPWAAFSSG